MTAIPSSGHDRSSMMPSEPISSPSTGSATPCAARSCNRSECSGEGSRISKTAGQGTCAMSIAGVVTAVSCPLGCCGVAQPRMTVWSDASRSMSALLSANHRRHASKKSDSLAASSSRTTQMSLAGGKLTGRSRVRMLKRLSSLHQMRVSSGVCCGYRGRFSWIQRNNGVQVFVERRRGATDEV